jgi:hypothetical protein
MADRSFMADLLIIWVKEVQGLCGKDNGNAIRKENGMKNSGGTGICRFYRIPLFCALIVTPE